MNAASNVLYIYFSRENIFCSHAAIYFPVALLIGLNEHVGDLKRKDPQAWKPTTFIKKFLHIIYIETAITLIY